MLARFYIHGFPEGQPAEALTLNVKSFHAEESLAENLLFANNKTKGLKSKRVFPGFGLQILERTAFLKRKDENYLLLSAY